MNIIAAEIVYYNYISLLLIIGPQASQIVSILSPDYIYFKCLIAHQSVQ